MLYSHTTKLIRFYTGADGLKTGYTDTAGFCLTATAKRNNMRLIAVVMKEESSGTRNAEVSSMLDYGYATYKTIEVINKDEVISEAEVDKASLKYASIVAIQNVSILKKKTESVGKITYELKLSNLKAPIKSGDIVGTLNIKENNIVITKVDVTIKEDIKKASFMDLYLRHLSDIVDGKISF